MPTRAWEEKVESFKSTYLVYFGYIGTETPSELRLAGHGVPSDYVYGAEMRIAKFYFNGLLDIPSSYYHMDALGSTRFHNRRQPQSSIQRQLPALREHNIPSGNETYKFTGKPLSTATGLYYDYNR